MRFEGLRPSFTLPNNLDVDIYSRVTELLADDELMNQIKRCYNVVLIKNNNTRDLCAHTHLLRNVSWKLDKQKYKYLGPFR